jgi:hypothetical protein
MCSERQCAVELDLLSAGSVRSQGIRAKVMYNILDEPAASVLYFGILDLCSIQSMVELLICYCVQ